MTDWKSKLAAYLHDPPSKCLDISTHGERSDAAFKQAGFVNEEEIGAYLKQADHAGAAADRLPFPGSRAGGLQCAFDGRRNAFRHPLCGEPLPFHSEFKSVEQGFEGEGVVQPRLSSESLAALQDDEERWRAAFFAHWRLWPQFAMEKDYRLGLLPADTRIPDHSIWTHMQVVSALAGCREADGAWRPAFLKFQLGPVQEFIAAARSIRDLWSGSYLLSWLMAAGLKVLSQQIGPDAVIFPSLSGQPLFDLHWRKELWSRVAIGNRGPVWDSLGWKDRDLLTPNLPNVFLAVAPASQAASLGQVVARAIQDEWQAIAGAVWKACEAAGLTADEGAFTSVARKTRFDTQVKRFLTLSWQATPWPGTLEEALKLADGFPEDTPLQQTRARVQAVVEMAEKQTPMDHRDRRFYTDDTKTRLNNVGLGWAVILARNGWELDAVRQTRAFDAAHDGGWDVGTFSNKDSLTGREEAVAGGREWVRRAEAAAGYWPSLFKKEDWLGAPTLIKRLWHAAYLAKDPWRLKTSSRDFPMPDTRSIARHDPFGRDDDVENEAGMEQDSSEKYFAVLALDGDEIGKWVSGKKTPPFKSQLAGYTDSGGHPCGASEYFTRDSDPDNRGPLRERFARLLDSPRPLSPGYHLQFSQALANFALQCARPIVEAFDGRLIYAGGDDVLALLPAETALTCARALRRAFQGTTVEHPARGRLFLSPAPGFLHGEGSDDHGRGRPIPLLVPGPTADCSVGIAIAHFKAPLQDVVRAAQQAEKRAKREPASGGLGRSAVAVTLMKRSGEIIQWGAQWNNGGLEAYECVLKALDEAVLSRKFPHRVIELANAYLTTPAGVLGGTTPADGFAAVVDDILQREIGIAAERQRGSAYSPDRVSAIQAALASYVGGLHDASAKVTALIGLCQTVAFAHRTSGDADSAS